MMSRCQVRHCRFPHPSVIVSEATPIVISLPAGRTHRELIRNIWWYVLAMITWLCRSVKNSWRFLEVVLRLPPLASSSLVWPEWLLVLKHLLDIVPCLIWKFLFFIDFDSSKLLLFATSLCLDSCFWIYQRIWESRFLQRTFMFFNYNCVYCWSICTLLDGDCRELWTRLSTRFIVQSMRP